MTKLVCKGKPLKMKAFSFIPVNLRVDLMENNLFLKIDFDGGRGQLEVDLSDIRKVLENLKTSPNKDFTVQSVSPKVCPQCYPNSNIQMIEKKGEYWICPKCSRCIEGKPS